MRVVFVHCANCDSDYWKKWFDVNDDKTSVYRQTHQLEFINLPWSSLESMQSPANIQETIIEQILLPKLAEPENTVVVGHSFGAYFVAGLAHRHPSCASKFVLVNPAGLSSWCGNYDWFGGFMFRYFFPWRWWPKHLFPGANVIAKFIDHSFFWRFTWNSPIDSIAHLPNVRILLGRQDWIVGIPPYLRAHIGFRVLEKTDHHLPIEEKEVEECLQVIFA